MNPGILKTREQARLYARATSRAISESVCIFAVAPNTMAHDLGFRFGTCRASERADYERDGATIIATVHAEEGS